MNVAYLSNSGEYTYFTFEDTTIKFLTSRNLERYTSIVEWDDGYLVVMSKNFGQEEVEDYIDMKYILKNLYMKEESFLSKIEGVEIKNVRT